MDIQRIIPLFGATVTIILYDIGEELAQMYFDEIHAEALRLQKIFNFYDDASELSQLNKQRSLVVSAELLTVLQCALTYCELSNGRYDITFGKSISAMKLKGEHVDSTCNYKHIKLDGSCVTLTHPDVCIDLGSIAKGYIVDTLAVFIQDLGIESGFIDARGDLLIFGNHLELVDVAHPRRSGVSDATLVLENRAVATSGDYNQYYGSMDSCHIIGKLDLISTTVVTESLMHADVLATCLFLGGFDGVESLLASHPHVAALAYTSDLQCHEFNGISNLYEEVVKNGF